MSEETNDSFDSIERDSYGNDPKTYDVLDSRNFVDVYDEWIG